MAWCFAPLYLWPMLFLSLPLFATLVQRARNARVAMLRSFLFGYGFFMSGTWWIANALLVDAERFGWLLPFSVLGLSAVMAVWFLPLGWLVYRCRKLSPFLNLLAVAAAWTLIDYARSFGMFGFPWNLAGYISLASLPAAQLASMVSVYGMSFLAIFIGLCPLVWARNKHVAWALPVALLAGLYGYGAWRMPSETAFTETKVRLVQASIPQSLKWTLEGKRDALALHAELSTDTSFRPDVILWPETAFPYGINQYSPWPMKLAQLLPSGSVLITGAQRVERQGEDIQLWNSLIAIDPQGNMPSHYDKHQLVPFGEFMPFRTVLPLDKITEGAIDFSRGAGPRTLHVGTVPPFSPLICYEIIFPHLAVARKERPAWIVNVTNDAWYGDTAGPYQHFAAAQMRAIENGLPVARVANNGISGMIDPYGRVVASLNLNQRGNVDVLLPAALTPRLYGFSQ